MAAFQATSGAATANEGANLTYSMTVSAGSNLALFVGVAIEGTVRDIDSVTFNGDALTQVGTDTPSGGSFAEAQMWRRVAPDVATGNVVVDVDSTFSESLVSVAVSMTLVDQTTPTGSVFTHVDASTGTSATVTVTDAADDDLIIDFIALDSNVNVAEGADQTNQGEGSITGKVTGACSTQLGSANDVMSWSWTGNRPFALMGVAFKHDGSGVATISIDVSDAVTVAESVTVQLLPILLNVNDAVTVAESLTVQLLPILLDVNDAVTVSEDVTVRVHLNADVSDAVAVAEDVTIRVHLNIDANDAVTVADAITVSLITGAGLSINAGDDIAVTEAITMHMALNITTADAVTVAESVTVHFTGGAGARRLLLMGVGH